MSGDNYRDAQSGLACSGVYTAAQAIREGEIHENTIDLNPVKLPYTDLHLMGVRCSKFGS